MRLLLLAALTALLAGAVGGASASQQLPELSATLLSQLASEPAPGGLPTGFQYSYNDSYHGWPVTPLHSPHALRASFDDPRSDVAGPVYHLGVDIAVNDDKRDKGATGWHSHRVYSIESGVVSLPAEMRLVGCSARQVTVGHFTYSHVDAFGTVSNGQFVHAGEPIGWSCEGQWHVHVSEYQTVDGQLTAVNPLHPGGKLTPFVDSDSPVISAITFESTEPATWDAIYGAVATIDHAQPLDPMSLHGSVDVRAEAYVPQSVRGFMVGRYADLYAPLTPYELDLIVRRPDGSVVLARPVFRADSYFGGADPALGLPIDFTDHFSAPMRQTLPSAQCRQLYGKVSSCAGSYWFHLFATPQTAGTPFFNTRSLPDGAYLLTVVARNVNGALAEKTVPFRIVN